MAALVPPTAAARHVQATGSSFRILESSTLSPTPTPLLLIHGGGWDNAGISWYTLFPALGQGRHLIAPDLPGFGESEACNTPQTKALPHSSAHMADQLATLLSALTLHRIIACGVSMGGEVALQLALRHPERVAGLVAIAPGGLIARFGSPWLHTLTWLSSRVPDGLLLAYNRLSTPFIPQLLKRVTHNPNTLPKEAVAAFIEEAKRPQAGLAYGRYNRASIGQHKMTNNLLPEVHRIRTPALLFHGRDDRLVLLSGSEEAVKRMPNARLEVVERCGHWAQLEQPERFLQSLKAFLSEHAL